MAQAASWLELAPDHPFGLAALPYGSYTASHHSEVYRIGVADRDRVLDLTTATERLLPGRAHLFSGGSLDALLAAGHLAWAQVRADLIQWLSVDRFRPAIEDLLTPAEAVELRLPFTVADYADFYCSEHHASNIGKIFRPDAEP